MGHVFPLSLSNVSHLKNLIGKVWWYVTSNACLVVLNQQVSTVMCHDAMRFLSFVCIHRMCHILKHRHLIRVYTCFSNILTHGADKMDVSYQTLLRGTNLEIEAPSLKK